MSLSSTCQIIDLVVLGFGLAVSSDDLVNSAVEFLLRLKNFLEALFRWMLGHLSFTFQIYNRMYCIEIIDAALLVERNTGHRCVVMAA